MRPEHVNNMPAPSSTETETDTGMTDRRPSEPESPATSHNIVSLVSRLADDHLTLVRVGVRLPFIAGRLAAKMVAAVTLLRGSPAITHNPFVLRQGFSHRREGGGGGGRGVTSHQRRHLIDNVK